MMVASTTIVGAVTATTLSCAAIPATSQKVTGSVYKGFRAVNRVAPKGFPAAPVSVSHPRFAIKPFCVMMIATTITKGGRLFYEKDKGIGNCCFVGACQHRRRCICRLEH
jgi:hypothetical protein